MSGDIIALSGHTGELMVLAGLLAAAGVVTGFVSGLLGIGGGSIMVPTLYEVFGAIGVADAQRMHLAIGTSLAVIVPTSLRSFLSHRKTGAVDDALVRSMALPVFAGVATGIVIAGFADASGLKGVWVVMTTIMSIRLFMGDAGWRLGGDVPRGLFRALYGMFVGAISTLMSAGGGIFITTMMLVFGHKIRQSVATASGFGPLIAIPGALGFVWAGWHATDLPPGSLGFVSLFGALIIIPASVAMAPVGVRLAHAIPHRSLELAFAGYMALIAVWFLVSLVSPIT